MTFRAVAFVLLAFLPGVADAQTVLALDPSAGELPVAVAIDKVGNPWVSLQPICEVRRFTPGWQESLRVQLVTPCTGRAGSSGLAVDATGVAYAAVIVREDVRGVYAIQPTGTFERLPGTEQMIFPNSLAFDHNNGTLYVTDMIGGAVWRIPQGGSAELWIQHPALTGIPIPGAGIPGGANGIAVDHGHVLVSVSFLPRLVKIPINEDGSAGEPQILFDTGRFFGIGLFALDDIALDVFGNIYASIVAGPPAVARLAADGTAITLLQPLLPGAVTSVAFGTGKGERKSLFAATNPQYGGTAASVVRLSAGAPGRPVP